MIVFPMVILIAWSDVQADWLASEGRSSAVQRLAQQDRASTNAPLPRPTTRGSQTAQTATVGNLRVGQRRQPNERVGNSPQLGRIETRVPTRVRSRLRSRIDRYFDPSQASNRPFETAQDTVENASAPPR